jgi:biotin-(acetyl-CoA carboxylase) ligase
VPVAPKFPEVPERILQKCPQLEKLKEEPKLSEVAKNITNNYTTYYECAVKHDAFVEWYRIQKKIYESVK